MPLPTICVIYTARLTYPGDDRLDISINSKSPFGQVFAPDAELERMLRPKPKAGLPDVVWERYERGYHDKMAEAWHKRAAAWDKLLARAETTLCCSCPDPTRCHRDLLASYLAKAGADVRGERPRVEQAKGLASPEPRPELRRCFGEGCKMSVRADQLMCWACWNAVPPELRRAIMATFRKGQENDPALASEAYITAARDARAAVALKKLAGVSAGMKSGAGGGR